jgi:two-component system, NtrC family, sensor kinase
MRLELPFRWRSLKAKLISNYLVILGIGGLVTSTVGSYIVSSTIMMQARRSVDHDLTTAGTIYEHQLETLKLTVHFLAAGSVAPAYLEAVRKDYGFDFLKLSGDSSLGVVRAALAGQVAAGTESSETLGMALVAAAPVRGPRGEVVGALSGGVRLNRNFALVDRAWNLIFKGERFDNENVGAVTVFQDDLRISTTLRTSAGERAVGTRASSEVRDAVLRRGEKWRGRAFVVRDWYISAYDPIRDYDGRIVGMLFVGALERAYTATRDRVILSFFGIATIGFILIIGITYYEIRAITSPVAKMVAATRNIAAGRFDQEVQSSGQGEITLLADSFNTMLKSLRQMKGDLEEWGRTLEEKVKQRTEELVAVEARVAQSERLASLGMLAAGVAHEINNPLGAILALTALTLEDTRPDDPDRENLEEVLKQAQRCRDIVKGLLEFSRQSEIHTERVDVNRILEDTLSLISKQAAFFNVTVVKNWEPRLPAVMGDKSQLQQVFMNILMNSVQAMEERGTIAMTTRRGRLGDVEVVVSDTGRGIPEEVIARIFDPFFTTKGSGEGTGLGLSIAYGLIAKHHGTIHVESHPAKGTTFTVRLPAAADGAQETRG